MNGSSSDPGPPGASVGAAPGGGDALRDAGGIIPRDLRFDLSANPTRHWFGGDLIRTVVVDGLAVCLPEGERYFIRALRPFASRLGDPDLAGEIAGYAAQEAYHTREHEDYNRALAALGYDMAAMEQAVRSELRVSHTPLEALAITCAIEHMTTSIATLAHRHPEILDEAAPAYRRLWVWHTLEELEHKAVGLNVMRAAMRDLTPIHRYLLRVIGYIATLSSFFFLFLRNVRTFARGDGVRTGPRFWLRFAWTVFIAPGYWRRCAPMLLGYLAPGYSPRRKDDAELVRRGREWLRRELAAA